ncbi:hypothetical protein YC2023_100289 [Brassica napus]
MNNPVSLSQSQNKLSESTIDIAERRIHRDVCENLHKRKMVEDFGNMCKVPARNFQTAINIALTKDIQVEENASKWKLEVRLKSLFFTSSLRLYVYWPTLI